MTVAEINFAMIQRMPVMLMRGSVVLTRSLTIRGLTKVRRSQFDEERGKDGFYWEVQLLDNTGRGWIEALPAQLDPYEPEKFASMMAEYQRLRGLQNAEQ